MTEEAVSIIERAAMAIADAMEAWQIGKETDGRTHYMNMARAALEAIRELTQAMIRAGDAAAPGIEVGNWVADSGPQRRAHGRGDAEVSDIMTETGIPAELSKEVGLAASRASVGKLFDDETKNSVLSAMREVLDRKGFGDLSVACDLLPEPVEAWRLYITLVGRGQARYILVASGSSAEAA